MGFAGQLDCGARALDLRPRLADRERLILHHGPIGIEFPLQEAFSEVLVWTSNHTEELVLLVFDRPDGEGCLSAVVSLLSDMRIAQLVPSDLPGLTLEEAKRRARHPSSGGLVLALPYGSKNNYDPSITCYGTGRSTPKGAPPSAEITPAQWWQHWSCYDPLNKAYAYDPLWRQVETTSASVPADNGELWMIQAHWQTDKQSIELGVLHKSSVVKDTALSQVNQLTAHRLSNTTYFKYMNLLEVDDVCNGGLQLLAALRGRSWP